MKFVYWTIAAIVILVAVVFALSNRHMVEIGFWPLPYLLVPGYVVGLGAFGAGFLCGAVLFWLRALGSRVRANMSERKADRLQHDVDDLREHGAAAEKEAADNPALAPRDETPRALERPVGAG